MRKRVFFGLLLSGFTFYLPAEEPSLPNNTPNELTVTKRDAINTVIEYFNNGKKEVEGPLISGKKEGLWRYWHENGQQSFEIHYRENKLDGLWTYWHENGQKGEQGQYKDNEQKGVWITWYDNGEKEHETHYAVEKNRTTRIHWYRDNKIKEISYSSSNYDTREYLIATTWFANGEKASEITYDYKNHLTKKNFWFDNGQIKASYSHFWCMGKISGMAYPVD